MGVMKNKAQRAMLGAKGIRPGDGFRFADEREKVYWIAPDGQFLNLDGEKTEISEDAIWEGYDRIERLNGETYERIRDEYRDKKWRSQGQPDKGELDVLAALFIEEYFTYYESGRWKNVCGYREETLGRLLEVVLDRLFPDKGETSGERRKKYRQIYRDLVMAKAELSRNRQK